jgi:UDP-2,4-diacetamido-2,4,6-trideoxy-beta-L-altropyranose hydrolase
MAGFCALTGVPVALFRCDASAAIGAGHVMRCLALAEALGDIGWHIIFAVGPETTATVAALPASGFDVLAVTCAPESEPKFIRRRISGETTLLVVDHYGRDVGFEQAFRTCAQRILVFDDGTGRKHDCDLLVDAAARGAADYYGKIPDCANVLAGPRFAVLGHSFLAHREAALARRDGRPVKNILVSFGATDATGMTTHTLDGLTGKVGDIVITVALSSRAKCLEDVRSKTNPRTHLIVDCEDMAPLMLEADLAIGAAGTMAYERASLGLPAVILRAADNQRGTAQLFAAAGAAREVELRSGNTASELTKVVLRLIDDAAARIRMAQSASALVDGRGPDRLLWDIAGSEDSAVGDSVRLRAAESEDEAWLLDLQRQPQTRKYFRNPAAPEAEEHRRWFRSALEDSTRRIAIIEAGSEAAGAIRFDQTASAQTRGPYEISIALHPRFYGRGIASAAMSLVCRLFEGVTLDAVVMPENTASQHLFVRAGFEQVEKDRFRRQARHPGLVGIG